MDINGHRICPVQVIVVHHSFRLLQNCLSVSKSGMAESNVDHRTLSGLWKEKSVSARKKDRALFFREGVTASALNDRQISITTYKMIDRRYTSARFKDTSEKQPRRWVKIVTRPFSHIGRKLIIIIPLPVRAVDNNSDRTFVIHYTRPDSTFGEREIRRFTQL